MIGIVFIIVVTCTGISFIGTPDAGLFLITHNIIANSATPVTSKTNNDAVFILNYEGSSAGGALVDPSP